MKNQKTSKRPETIGKAVDLLKRLMHETKTIHLDMSGDHRYSLSIKAHKIITEAKAWLSENNSA